MQEEGLQAEGFTPESETSCKLADRKKGCLATTIETDQLLQVGWMFLQQSQPLQLNMTIFANLKMLRKQLSFKKAALVQGHSRECPRLSLVWPEL